MSKAAWSHIRSKYVEDTFCGFLTIKMKMKHNFVWKVQNVSQQLRRLFLSAIDHSTTELPFKSVVIYKGDEKLKIGETRGHIFSQTGNELPARSS